MKVSTELTPQHEAIVTVEVDDDQMQRALQRAAQHVSRIRPVPGFRPGKAPYNLVERAVGKDILVEEAIEELSKSLYPNVLKENNIEPADQGQLEIVQKEPPILKYTIPIKPEVKLGDYKSIHLTPPEIQVGDEEVNQVLERFQLNQATTVPVTRALQKGDTVTLDVHGGAEGQEPVDEKNLRIVIGDAKQPGLPFDEQLIGMMPGESKEITYTYPEDYADEKFRGKTAHYAVSIQDIKETQLPELNDEFAQAVSQFKTLDQFRGNVRDILRSQKGREAEADFADQVIDAVVGKSEIAFPSTLLDREVEHQLEHMREDVKRLGLTWDKYLQLSGKTEEQLRADTRPGAEKQLKRMLVLNELMDVEKPDVTRDEVNNEIDRLVEQTERAGGNANVARRSYTTREGRRNIEFNLRLAKTITKLVAMARGEPVTGKILTPDMVRERPLPSGLITNPNEVPDSEWPRGLERKA
jgi:trigger factor